MTEHATVGGRHDSAGASARMVYAVDPVAFARLEPAYASASLADLVRACELAERTVGAFARTGLTRRAELLTAIARNLTQATAALAARLALESGMTQERASVEVAILAAAYSGAADAMRAYPARAMTRDPAPVAVIGSELVSLSVSVCGTEAIQALSAACPIVAIAGAGWPGTSELLVGAVQAAAAEVALPPGIFSLLIGDAALDYEAVFSARPRAVHLARSIDHARSLYLLPHALNARAENIAKRFCVQLNDAAGQAAMRAAVLIAVKSEGYIDLLEAMVDATATFAPAFLRPARHAHCMLGLTNLLACGGADRIAEGLPVTGLLAVQAMLFETDAVTILAQPPFMSAISGPVGVLVGCSTQEEMLQVARSMRAPCLAGIYAEQSDLPLAHLLRTIAGDSAFNQPIPILG